MIAVVLCVMIVNYHTTTHQTGPVCLLSAESGLHSDNVDCSKHCVCDVKFPKYAFGFTTVVEHSPTLIYSYRYTERLQLKQEALG